MSVFVQRCNEKYGKECLDDSEQREFNRTLL